MKVKDEALLFLYPLRKLLFQAHNNNICLLSNPTHQILKCYPTKIERKLIAHTDSKESDSVFDLWNAFETIEKKNVKCAHSQNHTKNVHGGLP